MPMGKPSIAINLSWSEIWLAGEEPYMHSFIDFTISREFWLQALILVCRFGLESVRKLLSGRIRWLKSAASDPLAHHGGFFLLWT